MDNTRERDDKKAPISILCKRLLWLKGSAFEKKASRERTDAYITLTFEVFIAAPDIFFAIVFEETELSHLHYSAIMRLSGASILRCSLSKQKSKSSQPIVTS